MAIIGIVAAMTIPTLIHKFQIKALKSQFNNTYSIISQAYGLMKADSSLQSLYGHYAICELGLGCYRSNEFKQEFSKYIKVQSNVAEPKEKVYLTYDGSKEYVADSPSYATVKPDLILANGTYLYIVIAGSLDGTSIYFVVDINGDKKPNRIGYDLFHFVVQNSKDVVSGRKMTRLYTDEELKDDIYAGLRGIPCSIKSRQAANGEGCAWYAVKDICPDDNEKGYWECLSK